MRLPRILHRRRYGLLLRLGGNGIAQAAAAIGMAQLVRAAFVRMEQTGSGPSGFLTGLLPVFGALLLVTGISMTLRVFERRDAARLGEDYVMQVRLRLFDALTGGPALTLERRGLGPTMLRFVTDLTAVRQWVAQGIARLLVASLAIVGAIVALALIDPIAAVALAVLVVAGFGAALGLGRGLERRVRDSRAQRARLASRIGDRLRALAVVQVSGQGRRERKALSRLSRGLAEAAVTRASLSGMVRVIPEAVLGLSTVAILALGALRAGNGVLGYGDVIAALSVLGMASPQIRALGRIFEYRVNHRVATRKLRQLLTGASRPKTERRDDDKRPTGRLDLDNVSVAGALKDISATALPGQLIAVVGPGGSGKSSLLASVARLLRLDSGRVTLGGTDIGDFAPRAFARHVGMMSDDLPLLKGSLRANLTYRMPDADAGQLADAIALCGLDDVLESLPQGLDTRLTENNTHLPRGLRRRFMLARAVIGDPALLLFDEPDAGLDPEGRRVVDAILARRRSTALIATQDLERARGADIVWYLEDGRVVEAGPAAVLLSGDGPAARYFGGNAEPRSNVTPLRARP